MTSLDALRNGLIDRIRASRNEKLLQAIKAILESTQGEDVVSLSSAQIETLQMSERDIEAGDLVSEAELDEADKEWLK